jgi:hypothetical protein
VFLRRLGRAAALIALVLLPAGVGVTEPVVPVVVPDSVDLPVPAFRQQADHWCWLAVAEMVVYYKRWGASPRQCEILEIGSGAEKGACCADPGRCDRAGSLAEIRRVIDHFGGASSARTPRLSPRALYDVLRDGHVVVAALADPTGGPGHVVVIKGLRFQIRWHPPRNPNEPPGQEIVPWVSINDPRGIITESTPYENLARYWAESIVVE